MRKIEVECGSESLQWPTPHVKENLGHWGREVHEREIKKAIALALGWKWKTYKQQRQWRCGGGVDNLPGGLVDTRWRICVAR